MAHLALISILLFLAAVGGTYYLQQRYTEEDLDKIMDKVESGRGNKSEQAVLGFAASIAVMAGVGVVTGIVYVLWYLFG